MRRYLITKFSGGVYQCILLVLMLIFNIHNSIGQSDPDAFKKNSAGDVYEQGLLSNSGFYGANPFSNVIPGLLRDNLAFNPLPTYEIFDGSSWIASSIDISNLFIGIHSPNKSGALQIPSNAQKVRFTWNPIGGYFAWSRIVMAQRLVGNTATVTLRQSTNGSDWVDKISKDGIAGWPGVSVITHQSHTSTENHIQIEIEFHRINTYQISISSLGLIGVYDSRETLDYLYSWNHNKDLDFNGNLKANKYNGNLTLESIGATSSRTIAEFGASGEIGQRAYSDIKLSEFEDDLNVSSREFTFHRDQANEAYYEGLITNEGFYGNNVFSNHIPGHLKDNLAFKPLPKLEFYSGNSWSENSQDVSNLFIGNHSPNTQGVLVLPNEVAKIRFTWDLTGNYFAWSRIVMAQSFKGNTGVITLRQSSDGTNWSEKITKPGIGGWPSVTTLSNIGHTGAGYHIQIEIEINRINANQIDIKSLGLFGSYDSQTFRDRLYSWDYNKDVNFNGNVGIGVADHPDDFQLAVAGKIVSEEVNVQIEAEWVPDYVFAPEYNLMPLTEVEAFINKESHLPEVPSATEMEANGVNLKEMNMILLKKIEELTLHMISLNKEVEKLKKE